jgi:general secretion pathway protein G
MRSSPHPRQGFTLIEVLIVVTVVAILAAIVIPRLMGAGREAKEAHLRATLQQFRSSIALFRSHTGLYQAPHNSPPANGLDDTGESMTINALDYQGPYVAPNLPSIPYNAITGGNVEGVDWLYSTTAPAVGRVHAAAGPAIDGSDYSTW